MMSGAVPVRRWPHLSSLAEADGFLPSLRLARRDALGAIKALRDEPMPLFAAASNRESEIIPEIDEPTVMLRPMRAGGEVVEDYVHLGLSLRAHPVSFLRSDLCSRKIITCAQAMQAADNKWVETAGIVLVRQKPGSAKGVMFITIEDETGIANLVIWPSLYEKQRRIVHSAGVMAVYGPIQREGEVVHLVAHRLTDLSNELASIGQRDITAGVSRDHSVQTEHGRGTAPRETFGRKPRDANVLDHHIDTIKVKTRDFR
jgi:error-prone DNA polymerase